MAEYLTEKGADVKTKDNEGLTPLHYASLDGNFDRIQWKTDQSLRNLNIAGNKKMAKILLEHGADANAITNLGYTPLHHASSLGKFGYYPEKINSK